MYILNNMFHMIVCVFNTYKQNVYEILACNFTPHKRLDKENNLILSNVYIAYDMISLNIFLQCLN